MNWDWYHKLVGRIKSTKKQELDLISNLSIFYGLKVIPNKHMHPDSYVIQCGTNLYKELMEKIEGDSNVNI